MNLPNQAILVCDWLNTSHVIEISGSDWLITWFGRILKFIPIKQCLIWPTTKWEQTSNVAEAFPPLLSVLPRHFLCALALIHCKESKDENERNWEIGAKGRALEIGIKYGGVGLYYVYWREGKGSERNNNKQERSRYFLKHFTEKDLVRELQRSAICRTVWDKMRKIKIRAVPTYVSKYRTNAAWSVYTCTTAHLVSYLW